MGQLVLQIKRKTNTGNLNKNRKAAASRRNHKVIATPENTVGRCADIENSRRNTLSPCTVSGPEEHAKKRARISASVPEIFQFPARPKLVARPTIVALASAKPTKKYDNDPQLQPVTPMTPFLSIGTPMTPFLSNDLADFNWPTPRAGFTPRSGVTPQVRKSPRKSPRFTAGPAPVTT